MRKAEANMNGAQAVVRSLIKHRVKTTFGYPGGSIVPVFDAFMDYSRHIRNILVRHEQCAAHAADGFARASGIPGVCIATSGPGASNLITGLLTSFMDSTPIIAMAGQVPTKLIGHESFQEVAMDEITKHTCKGHFQLRDPNKAFAMIDKAFRLSTEARPGPVYIDLPKDAQEGRCRKRMPARFPVPKPRFLGQEPKLSQAASLVLYAERPLILIGGGIIWANAGKELSELVNLLKIPVARTMMAKSAFPDNHPLSLGMAGMYGTKIANYAIENSDLILAIGCRFSNRIATDPDEFAKNATLIHIDVEPSEINRNKQVELALRGDAKLVLQKLLAIIRHKFMGQRDTPWVSTLRRLRTIEYDEKLDYDSKPIDYKRIFYELKRFVKDEDIVVTGVGCHQTMAERYIPRKSPRSFISSGGDGTMGFGLPASIGAKTAKPDSEVINIDGDGSLQMVIQELAVLAKEGIKVITVLCNNQYLGMVRQWQKKVYGRYSSVNLGKKPDFAKVAEAYGLKGYEVNRPSDIYPCLQSARKSRRSSIIDIHVKPEEDYGPTEQFGITEKDF